MYLFALDDSPSTRETCTVARIYDGAVLLVEERKAQGDSAERPCKSVGSTWVHTPATSLAHFDMQFHAHRQSV